MHFLIYNFQTAYFTEALKYIFVLTKEDFIMTFKKFFNALIVLASYSKKKPIPVANKIAAMIPIVSAYSFSMMEIINEKAAATNNTRTTGSSNFSR